MITNALSVLMLAATIYAEAGGESFEGKRAVASVIHNRAAQTGVYVDCIVIDRKQFSCWNRGWQWLKQTCLHKKVKSAAEKKSWQQCEQLALQLYLGTFSPAGNWTYYYETTCKPAWRTKLVDTVVIGKQTFGRMAA